MAATCCSSCGRLLRAEQSASVGRGRTCDRRHRQDLAVAEFLPEQVMKAREVVELGGVVATGEVFAGDPVVHVVSWAGTETYVATGRACSCPAAQHGTRCWHLAAARLVATT